MNPSKNTQKYEELLETIQRDIDFLIRQEEPKLYAVKEVSKNEAL